MKRPNSSGMSRRRFLKATAGALAVSSIPTIIVPKRVEAYQAGAKIHPNISPLRVVGVRDARMTTEVNERAAWQVQQGLVAPEAIYENMDKMAMALAEESAAADAWKKVFVKPPGRSWADTVVAIKTNQIAEQRTRPPVMNKVCRVLTDVLGVKGSNIYVYDASHGGSNSIATENHFTGLPEGVHLADAWGGSNTMTGVPGPYFNGQRQTMCMGHLVRKEVDILVNIALCKGHGWEFGKFTMSMKNHFGTFDPQPSHRRGGGADYLLAINKTPEILGSMDPQTGNVLYPRQQLCIVDALWASLPGPQGLPTAQPNALLMGVFAPAVDHVTALRFRNDAMGWPVNEQFAERLLTEFGFAAADLPNGGQIIDALTAGA
jgi:hypothetical protein